jgi:acyl dehydratase
MEFTEQPPFLSLYMKIFFARKKGFKGPESVPTIQAVWKGAQVDQAALKEYRKACGFEEDGKLPILYPHILTSAIHMSLLAHPEFPLSIMGSVHARNNILQRRAIGETEPVDVECTLAACRVVKQGVEFDVTTKLLVGDDCPWESVSTYLVRKKQSNPGEPPAWTQLGNLDGGEEMATFHVPADMGRRYAKITGDYNPIHISKILAKLFGFPRDIIHGMWSLAKCITELPPISNDGPLRLDVVFKGPVFIDSDNKVVAVTEEGRNCFDLYCGKNDRPSTNARLERADANDDLIGQVQS